MVYKKFPPHFGEISCGTAFCAHGQKKVDPSKVNELRRISRKGFEILNDNFEFVEVIRGEQDVCVECTRELMSNRKTLEELHEDQTGLARSLDNEVQLQRLVEEASPKLEKFPMPHYWVSAR